MSVLCIPQINEFKLLSLLFLKRKKCVCKCVIYLNVSIPNILREKFYWGIVNYI